MVCEVIGYNLPWGDLQLFFGSLILFVIGGFFTFTPKLKSPFDWN